jgi:hypothetical protein
MRLCAERNWPFFIFLLPQLIAHDAISALINLTNSFEVALRLSKIPGFVTGLVRMIVVRFPPSSFSSFRLTHLVLHLQDEKAVLADLACMLLSNMSKLDTVSQQILQLRVPFTLAADSAETKEGDEKSTTAGASVQATEEEIAALDLLLEVFLKGEGKKYNPNANYDFLASVFANVTLVRRFLSSLLIFSNTHSVPLAATSRSRLPPRHS